MMSTAEINMSPEARRRVDRYLRQVRASLLGCRGVDAGEVERDVREHIETALHDAPPPVDEREVDGVLSRLGSPYQWAPVEELPWWRRALLKVRTGSEDQRLVHVSFLLLVLAFVVPVFFPVFLLGSVCMARTALSLAGGPEDLRAYRWMLYPQLLLTYLLPTAALLAWPAVAAVAIVGDNAPAIERHLAYGQPDLLAHAIVIGLAAAGVWWALVGLATLPLRRAVRAVYYPFLNRWGVGASVAVIAAGAVLVLPILFDGRARELARLVWTVGISRAQG